MCVCVGRLRVQLGERGMSLVKTSVIKKITKHSSAKHNTIDLVRLVAQEYLIKIPK